MLLLLKWSMIGWLSLWNDDDYHFESRSRFYYDGDGIETAPQTRSKEPYRKASWGMVSVKKDKMTPKSAPTPMGELCLAAVVPIWYMTEFWDDILLWHSFDIHFLFDISFERDLPFWDDLWFSLWYERTSFHACGVFRLSAIHFKSGQIRTAEINCRQSAEKGSRRTPHSRFEMMYDFLFEMTVVFFVTKWLMTVVSKWRGNFG